jgi:hypothetical protein
MLTILRKLMSGGERGQVIVAAVGVMTLSLGAIMISVDAGWWLRDKRDAQNDADAIAHSASLELPDRVAAELAGEDWAVANGIDPSTEMAPPDCADGDLQGNFCFIDRNSDGDDDKVRVKVSRPSNSFIAGVLGVGSPTLNPQAAAATVYVTAACVMPWAIQGTDDPATHFGLDLLYPEDHLYVFQNHGDFAGDSPGNFGAGSWFGEGGNVYKNAIKGLCEPANNSCTDEDMVFAGETLLGCTSEPGGMGAVTANALDETYPDAPSPGDCDVATHDEANSLVLDPDYPECWERAVPVAIINSFPPAGSSADIDIHGIVTFYLAGWSKQSTCFIHPDGTEQCGFVWGYLLDNIPVSTARAVFTADFVPFAPTGVALVE